MGWKGERYAGHLARTARRSVPTLLWLRSARTVEWTGSNPGIRRHSTGSCDFLEAGEFEWR